MSSEGVPSHFPSLSCALFKLTLFSVAPLVLLVGGYSIELLLDQFFSSEKTFIGSSIDFSQEKYC